MIYIWIRSTLNWEDEEAFNAQLRPDLVAPVHLWNSQFNMPYHVFRHRLRRISQVNLSRVDGAVCATWADIPDGALVVPVDDDDWFAPDLAAVLGSQLQDDYQACYWKASFLEVPINLRHQYGRIRRTIFPSVPAYRLCSTNNYAIRKGPGVQNLLESHVQASHWFESNTSCVLKLTQPLSCMNRTLGSTTSLLEKTPPFAHGKLSFSAYRYRRRYKKGASPELAWSQPYCEMMAELMDEL